MSFLTKIQLGSLGYLDIDENVSIPLNFSVAEIQDISKRQGGYSKTIKLPGTKNNNILLGQLFNVNIYDASFNQNLKTNCTVLQNGVPVFNGYLQLLNVVKNSPTALNPDQIKSYEVAVKDNTGDFYTSLQEKRLQDIDFSFYDHIYTLSAITSSSAHTSDDVYTYFLPNRQSGVYTLTDFSPAIYAKAYWDRIFFQAGYSYSWTGMTDTGFDKLIIPYNGDVPSGETSEAKFRAGYSSPVTNVLTLGGLPTSNYIPLGFNDDSTSPNFDTNNNFNLSTGEYTQPNNCKNQINVKYTWKIVSSAATDMHLEGVNRIRINMANFAYVNSENIAITDANFFVNEIDATTVIGSTPVVLFTGTSEFSYTGDFLIGDILEERVFTNFQIFTPGSSFNLMWLYDGTFINVPTNQYPDFYLVLGIDNNTDNNFIYSNPSSELKENSLIRINSFIPTQVKQKDFISSIIKMFNIFITNDEDDETNLIIQTRDEFYDSGKTLDWTKKIDMLSEQKLQFLPDVTNKRLLFSYKEDKDSYNTTYLQATGEIFGQQLYTFENEFVQDVKKVEPIFSPTPLLTNVFNNVVPAIDIQAPKNNIRILYYDGWIDGNWDFASGTTLVYLGLNNVPPVEFQDFIIPFTKYPYAGHFDNPYTPSIDIDYGTNDYELYNDWSYISNNNLYNKYYKRQVSQIETGKLLTAKFNLNEYDITNLDFRNKIWIHDSFWFVNKIVDYNANIDGSLSTVELINIDEGITFTPQQIEVENVGGKYSYLNNKLSLDTIIIDNTIGIGVSGTDILGGQGNVITDSTVRLRLAGNSNIAGVISGDIFGDINNVSGNDIFVNGSNNFIANGSNVNIQGNSNTLSASSQNIDIVGSGNTLGIYDTNIGIYNSNNNIIGDFVSGATLINSNNVTIASGVTNVVVINGNNLVITGSNQTYTSSANTGYFEVTWTDLTTILIPGNLLQVGALYKIDTEETTWKNNGLFLQAISTNQLEKIGIVLFLAPSTYQTITDGFGNVWLGIWQSSLTPSVGDLVIWGGQVWSNVNGLVGASVDYITLDSEWTLISKDTYSNNEYIEMILNCEYDITNNWFEKQFDGNGNIVGLDYISFNNIIGGINRVYVTDWNLSTNLSFLIGNECYGGFYNNILSQLTLNKSFSIYNNKVNTISYNDIGFSIFDNTCGGDIYYNTNKGNINNNSNTGGITLNSNIGEINSNTNSGSIFLNNNNGYINGNSCGEIFNNNNSDYIENNSNNGEISRNNNLGYISNNDINISDIRKNKNSGNIDNNTGTGGPWAIYNNINNGFISGNWTADVTDTIVNKV